MARVLKFWTEEVDGLFYICNENKGADQNTAQLICAFVLAYTKNRFSHDAAHLIYDDMVCPFSLYPARPPTEYFVCNNNMLEKGLLFSIC